MTKRPAEEGVITPNKRTNPYAKVEPDVFIPRKTNQEMLLEDADTRERFAAIKLHDGTIHVLHAGAGAGKTTLTIRLMKSVVKRYPTAECIALTFNVAAAADGEAKVNGADRLTFRTIDSFLFALFAEDIKGAVKVDFEVTEDVMHIARKILGRDVSPEQAVSYGDQLKTACDIGTCSNLGGEARTLWNAGMDGKWWSHSMLRVRARDDPTCRWAQAMAKYNLIVVDEAQDLNLVMISLMKQLHATATTVYVGDSAQAIYGFMGCTDVKHTLQQDYVDWKLYTTFRFGQAVCDFVNVRHLSAEPAVAHPDNPDTDIVMLDDAHAVLAGPYTVMVRSWHELINLADKYTAMGRDAYIDKDKVAELLKLATSPLPGPKDSLFRKICKAKVIEVLQKVNRKESSESIVLSTVHGFKGLEADRVMVMPTVRNARNDEEIRLLYVAVTRARQTLYLHKLRG